MRDVMPNNPLPNTHMAGGRKSYDNSPEALIHGHGKVAKESTVIKHKRKVTKETNVINTAVRTTEIISGFQKRNSVSKLGPWNCGQDVIQLAD